jgi:outer membrane protein, multidrug efflux system
MIERLSMKLSITRHSSIVSRRALALLLPMALAGCFTSTPQLPGSDVPALWEGPVIESAEIWPRKDWWNSFNNEELSGLVGEVQDNNLDLANNLRNLRAAQVALREAGFNLLPTPIVSIGAGAGFREVSDVTGNNSGSVNTPPTLGASFTYNDILSRPSTYERAVADYDSRVATVAEVALNTLGTASSAYFQILLTRDKIDAALQNLANAEAIGSIAQARVDAGVVVPIEALQQRIAIERERNNLRSLIQADLAGRASLALLLGRTVQGFDVEGQTLQTIEVPVVQPGIPSELLNRRPDLVRAEANLRAATADVDLVRLAFFPNISLTGGYNAASTSLTSLVSSPDTTLTISANLVQVLLDNGRRFRNMELSQLALENALANYRRAVLGAFNDIEVLLSNIQLLEALEQVAFENLEAAEESFRIAQARYEEGVADYQTVLIAQNTLFASRNSYLDNKLLRLNAVVGFYQALGGGWQADGETP